MPSISRKTIITSGKSGLTWLCFFMYKTWVCRTFVYKKQYRHYLKKAYVILLTCRSSCALHLELTPDMKTLAFIRAIERFTARREAPIINDMFKTFKSPVVKKFMLCSEVRQKFILPATATLLKRRLWHRCFPVNFAKFLRTPFFYRTPLVAAFDLSYLHGLDSTSHQRDQ